MPVLPDPNENVSGMIVEVTAFFTGLTVFCLVCRFVSRKITGVGLGLDDFLSLSATVSCLGSRPLGLLHHGLVIDFKPGIFD